MQLVICEKPSQAQGYASVLGANERKGGFFIGNGFVNFKLLFEKR